MGLGILPAVELAHLAVVQSGAAKDLYRPGPARELTETLLRGDGLTLYRHHDSTAAGLDPIADVMVAGKVSVGLFGGALRRILYAADQLQPTDVQAAQCLTEQVTQQALSVKAGQPPLRYRDFERQLQRLLRGQESETEAPADLRKVLALVWETLRALMPGRPLPWLEWLRKPHELAVLLPPGSGATLRLPLRDLRLRGWVE
jgi:hypothetical protein